MEEVILKSLRNEKKKFNGKRAVVLKQINNGGLSVRCCGLPFDVKKHQFKEASE